jgi:tetratricopeptide (TPR) repeat protein
MSRAAKLLWLLALAAASAQADTIVLKSGRRITASNVIEEADRVRYETSAGWLSLSKSLVERIERGGSAPWSSGGSSGGTSEPAVTAPQFDPGQGYQDVVRAVTAGGSIDWNYLARLESEARGGAAPAVARVAVAHHAAAQLVLGKGEIEDAIGHYRRALTFAPEHLGLLLSISYLHLRRSEFTTALDYLESARRVVPDSPDVAKLMGWAYSGQNKIDQAVQEWQRAYSLRPDPDVQRALEKAERDQEAEKEYREGETSHFILRYHGGEAPALAHQMLRTLEDHFRAIESELNFTPPEAIGVILYTQQAFADITRVPGWVGALNDGRIRVPVQGLEEVTPRLSRMLKHELTHSFVYQKTQGRCPTWLQEGIAQWMEGQRSQESAQGLVAVYERNAAVPVGVMLEDSFLALAGDAASHAYAWSLAVVEYIVQTYGMGDIERLLDRVASEARTEAAVRSTFRTDYAGLAETTSSYLRRTYLR